MTAKTNINLVMKSEDAQALQSLIKLAQAQEKVADETRQVNRETREQGESVSLLDGAWGSMIATAGGMVSVGALLRGVIEQTKAFKDHLGEIEGTIRSMAQVSIPLATLLSPEQARMAAGIGALAGLTKEQAVPAYQEISSWSGLQPEVRQRALQEVADLINLGAEQEGALRLVKLAGDPRAKVSPEMASAIAYRAAELSALSLTEFAGQSGAIAMYSTAQMGAATLAALSELPEFGKEELTTYHKAMKRALGQESKFTKAMAAAATTEGLDWAEMNEIQRLELIERTLPETSFEALQKAGLGEQRAGMAISGAIAQLPAIRSKYEQIGAVGPELTDVKLAELYKTPMYRAEFQERQMAAGRDYVQAYGSYAPRAIQQQAGLRAKGLEMEADGLGHMVTEEGIPNWRARFLYGLGRVLQPFAAYGGTVPGPLTEMAPSAEAWQRPEMPGLERANILLEEIRDEIARLNATPQEVVVEGSGGGGGGTEVNMGADLE